MKFPKLHLACSTDDWRPAIQCVQIGKEFTFATDAHICVRHKTSELFDQKFMESLPDDPILVPWKAFAYVIQKATESVSLSDDKKSFQIHRKDGSIWSYRLFTDVSYVNANSVFPDPANGKPVEEIGLNSNLLDRLTDAMGCDIPIIRMKFYGDTNAILVTSKHTDYPSASGVIMPRAWNY